MKTRGLAEAREKLGNIEKIIEEGLRKIETILLPCHPWSLLNYNLKHEPSVHAERIRIKVSKRLRHFELRSSGILVAKNRIHKISSKAPAGRHVAPLGLENRWGVFQFLPIYRCSADQNRIHPFKLTCMRSRVGT